MNDLGQLPYHAQHIFRSRYHDQRQAGQDASGSLAFLGAATVAIGVKMLWDAFLKMKTHPDRGHGR